MKLNLTFFIYLCVLFITISCQNDVLDDDLKTSSSLNSSSSKKDFSNLTDLNVSKFYGKWFLDDYYWKVNPSCEQKSYIQFNNDGTFERKDYFYDSSNNKCYLDGNHSGFFKKQPNCIDMIYHKEGYRSKSKLLNFILDSNGRYIYFDFDEDGDGIAEDLGIRYRKDTLS